MLAIRNPAAGVPVSTGFTGSVRDCLLVKMGIVTWTVRGSMSTPVTISPAASIASTSISRSTSRPLPSIGALARAATTRLTATDGPVTVTLAGSTVSSPMSRPAGGEPRSTTTSTTLGIDWSRTTWIDWGRKSRIVTRGSVATTVTRTLTGDPSGVTLARSTVARKSSAVRRPRSAGAM